MKPLQGTKLKRFLRDYRRERPPAHDLVALLQSIEYPANVGSCFRLADGAGMTELVLTGITPTPPNATIDKVGRFKSTRVPWRYEKDALTAVDGAQRLTATISWPSNYVKVPSPITTYDYPPKTCLVVGHEDHGVTKATLAACDAAVFLPMYGKGLSLNVHVALSIVTYHILHCAQTE